MFRRLRNVIVRVLLPYSDYATSVYENRALAIAEIALAISHLHDAAALLGRWPGRDAAGLAGRPVDRITQSLAEVDVASQHVTLPPYLDGVDNATQSSPSL